MRPGLYQLYLPETGKSFILSRNWTGTVFTWYALFRIVRTSTPVLPYPCTLIVLMICRHAEIFVVKLKFRYSDANQAGAPQRRPPGSVQCPPLLNRHSVRFTRNTASAVAYNEVPCAGCPLNYVSTCFSDRRHQRLSIATTRPDGFWHFQRKKPHNRYRFDVKRNDAVTITATFLATIGFVYRNLFSWENALLSVVNGIWLSCRSSELPDRQISE